jgi:hypothetical protein
LALCVDGVESQGAFAASGNSRKNNQFIFGNFDIYVFKIVLPGPFYFYEIIHVKCPPVLSGGTPSISQ